MKIKLISVPLSDTMSMSTELRLYYAFCCFEIYALLYSHFPAITKGEHLYNHNITPRKKVMHLLLDERQL